MQVFNKIKSFIKNNFSRLTIISLFCFSFTLHLAQFVTIMMINSNNDAYNRIVSVKIDNLKDIFKNNIDIINNRLGILKNADSKLNDNIEIINAKIDTIDSTIDPKLKRRELLKKIRDSILENTDTKLSIRTLNRIANAVIDASYENNIPIALILAQIKQESDFNPKAESHASAKGLMQILDHTSRSTADEIAGELGYRHYNIWNINTNVKFGAYYISKMLNEFNNNLDDALRAYNFGPDRVLEVKAGKVDYSLSKIIIEDGKEKKYLVDKYGAFKLDKNGKRILIEEKHRYPKETRNYIKIVKKNRQIFAKYGLDKVE